MALLELHWLSNAVRRHKEEEAEAAGAGRSSKEEVTNVRNINIYLSVFVVFVEMHLSFPTLLP